MNRLRELYFALWAICLPVGSVLVLPSVQGTTPGNLLALGSVIWVPFLSREKSALYLKLLWMFAAVWSGFAVLSQLGLFLFDNPKLPQVLSIDYFDASVLFRRSIATQSAYLVTCFLTLAFFLVCYQSEWRKYLFWGAWLLVIYGIYEWLFFLIMHRPGDFLVNRTFMGGEHTGSWSQILQVGKIELLRIKSTTGEPSFLGLAALPYLILALESRKWALAGGLFFCLLLSFSTTAYLSLILLGAFSLFYLQLWKHRLAPWLGVMVGVGILLAVLFPNLVATIFSEKLAGRGPSGNLRQHIFLMAWEHWTRLSLMNKVFGIGFGSAFVTPFLGGVLVNTGLVGVAVFLAGFLWPVFRLPNLPENWSLKAMLLVTLLMLSVSVADFTYLTTWMVLGLAYRRLRRTGDHSPAAHSTHASGTRHREHRRSAVTPTFQALGWA